MGAVESVLREVEKVTIRPLGEVARGVERVAIRPLGEVARGVERVMIRPLGDIVRELEKVTIRPLGEVARGIEKVTLRQIACDLEEALPGPLGVISSKTVLLADAAEQETSMDSNIDRQTRRENLNEMAIDAEQLQGDINELISTTSATDDVALTYLGNMYIAVSRDLRGSIRDLQNINDTPQINELVVRGNEELLRSENQSLRDRVDFLEARIRNAVLIEDDNYQSDSTGSTSDSESTLTPDFA